ncbi:NAD(P)-dependent iron-only hydrogenase catalytic subunit [Halanaerobium sp. DL-01]|uniref:NADH-dependent [FeFe] hydrogenase, group A6 n=1 Tax=Halanaerobium sp. DL-01 TaxID=1653064 RepID=UPI000DF1349A|nr:NADH-dependent [FeFe] hydrogenase, group A6 [Halanaerobium sp. DL-01]RCW89146.1 NAD(P)-dependent iron-only hydrogenase catalytic subunit [Halanaerobium sp. DL-01]
MNGDKVTIWINDDEYSVDPEMTVLEAAQEAGKDIPTLCYLKDINEIGACRLCLVEIENTGKLAASCITPVSDGMKIKTNTSRVRNTRKLNLEFLLSNHKIDCPTCLKNEDCELRKIAEKLKVRENRFEGKKSSFAVDDSTPSLFRDSEKCILCRRCENVCREVQSVRAIMAEGRGFDTVIDTAFYDNLAESPCVMCGQCSLVCPTGAITEVEYIDEVWAAIADPDKHVVVQTAPAVRVALSEAFGNKPGTIFTGQMVAALRKLGFDRVFDTNFTADLTIMEEGTELIKRIKDGGKLPLFTSCSPGWIKFIEHYYPEYLDNLSSCKSPQQMFGAVANSYYAEKENINPENLVVVSIMPCTAKKYEAQRPEMEGEVDYVLTTRELARMINEAGFNANELKEEEHDQLLGVSSGAGAIFGSTGGVMEAGLRTAYEIITGEELKQLDFTEVRGFDGIKKTSVQIGDLNLKVAVANGLSNARKIMEMIKEGEEFHFVEFMACPGGCLGGGGQPLPATEDVLKRRMDAIYEIDSSKKYRKSHENPYIKKIYEEYFEEPGSHKAHELLHTTYIYRGI